MAPEFQYSEGYSYGADIWALGVNMYMAIFGKDPWANSEYKIDPKSGKFKLYSSPKQNRLTSLNCGKRLPFPYQPTISEELKDIFRRMLEIETNQRITWDQLFFNLTNKKQSFNNSPQTIPQPVNSDYRARPEEQFEEASSEIVNRITFKENRNQTVSKKIQNSIERITQFKINQFAYPPARYFDLLISENLACEDPNEQSIVASLAQDSYEENEEVIEQFIIYYTYICDLFLQSCDQLEYSATYHQSEYGSLKGIMYLLINYAAKKVIQIAIYFIQKLSDVVGKFTQIGIKYEFYQNNFAKQYLERFDEIQIVATKFCSISVDPADKFVPPKFYRREVHLSTTSVFKTFAQDQDEGFHAAMFYMFVGVEKFSPIYQKPQIEQAKKLLVQLSIICRYKDTLVFKAGRDQFEALARELGETQDPSKLEIKYQQDRDYFRKWKDSLKN
jgi:hypothetical protein